MRWTRHPFSHFQLISPTISRLDYAYIFDGYQIASYVWRLSCNNTYGANETDQDVPSYGFMIGCKFLNLFFHSLIHLYFIDSTSFLSLHMNNLLASASGDNNPSTDWLYNMWMIMSHDECVCVRQRVINLSEGNVSHSNPRLLGFFSRQWQITVDGSRDSRGIFCESVRKTRII